MKLIRKLESQRIHISHIYKDLLHKPLRDIAMASKSVVKTKEELSYDELIKSYDPANNISRNTLTRYERTLIIGMRLEQLARGAKSFVDISDLKGDKRNIREIAERELKQKAIPFMIVRTMPNGDKEYYRLSDMIITDT